MIAFQVWLGGVAVSGLVLLMGLARLAWLASRSVRLTSGRWASAAADVSRLYGMHRPPRVLQSTHPTMLVTWGVVRPKVILPSTAPDWSDDRMRVVLAHELAHIHRGDWAAQMAAEILRAVYWFNPLVWAAAAELRQESEHACDDTVIRSGVDASDYAAHLLHLARTLRSPRPKWFPAPALVRRNGLERRITAMLNSRLNRAPATRTSRAAIVVGLLALTLPVAGFGQGSLGTFTGTVTDQMGGVIPKVSLVLTHVPSNAKHTVQTDDTGRFEFVGLRAGDHVLEASGMGFRTLREPLTISSGQTVHRTFLLQVGSLQETIRITHSDSAAERETAPLDATTQQLQQLAAEARRAQYVSKPCTPATVGGQIRPPVKLLDKKPVYPANLRGTGTEGPTTMEARIGVDGSIQEVRVIGTTHPDLASAAADAVRQWQFSPTLLNCVPIEVDMTVTATFNVER
jgi:TonB family protein